mmetsp:Transcript_25228/g.58368  ORF Transcript_25228/g.58368 Transcript_25228/m.58368 type:complete len:406 (+) Transcript_25228:232-1449(+)
MAKAPLRSFCLKAEILCKEEAESEAGRSFLVAAGASDGKVRLELLLPPRTPGLSRAPGLSEFFQICELPSEHGPALSLALCAVPPHVDGSGDSGVGGGDSGGGGGEGAVPVLLLVGSTDGVLRVYDVTDAAATALVVARTVAKGAQACEKAGGEEEDVLSSLLLAVRVHGMGVNDLSVCACHGSCKSGSCDLPTSAFVQAAKMEGAKVETAKMEVAKVGAAKMEVAKMGATGRRVRVGTGGDDQGVSLLELEIFGAGPEWQVRVVRGLRLECVHGAAVRGVRLSCHGEEGCAGRLVSTGPDQRLKVLGVRWDALPPPIEQATDSAPTELVRADGRRLTSSRTLPDSRTFPDSRTGGVTELASQVTIQAVVHTAVQHANALDVFDCARGGSYVAVAGEGLELFEMV